MHTKVIKQSRHRELRCTKRKGKSPLLALNYCVGLILTINYKTVWDQYPNYQNSSLLAPGPDFGGFHLTWHMLTGIDPMMWTERATSAGISSRLVPLRLPPPSASPPAPFPSANAASPPTSISASATDPAPCHTGCNSGPATNPRGGVAGGERGVARTSSSPVTGQGGETSPPNSFFFD